MVIKNIVIKPFKVVHIISQFGALALLVNVKTFEIV